MNTHGACPCSISPRILDYALGKMIILFDKASRIAWLFTRDDIMDMRKCMLIASNMQMAGSLWVDSEAQEEDRIRYKHKQDLLMKWMAQEASRMIDREDPKSKKLAGIAKHLQCCWFAALYAADQNATEQSSNSDTSLRFHTQWQLQHAVVNGDVCLTLDSRTRARVEQALSEFEQDCEAADAVGQSLKLGVPPPPEMKEVYKSSYSPCETSFLRVVQQNDPHDTQWMDVLKIGHMVAMTRYIPEVDWANELYGYTHPYDGNQETFDEFLGFAKATDVVDFYQEYGRWPEMETIPEYDFYKQTLGSQCEEGRAHQCTTGRLWEILDQGHF